MSNPNFNRNPTHSFDIVLAASIGVYEAILVNHFQYWISLNKRKKKNLHEGRTWMYESREDIAAHFPYLSPDQVRRLTDKLVDIGILIKGNFNKTGFDRTIWYAFNKENEFLNNSYDWQICQMEMADLPNRNGEIAKTYKDIDSLTDPKESSKQASSQPAASFCEKKIYSCMDGLPFNDKQKSSLCMLDLSDQSEQIVTDAVAKYKQRIAEGYVPENRYGFLQTLILDKDKPTKPKTDQVEDNRSWVIQFISDKGGECLHGTWTLTKPGGMIEALTKYVEIGNRIHQPTCIEYTDGKFKNKFLEGLEKWGIKLNLLQ